jgi:hypothetical protein
MVQCFQREESLLWIMNDKGRYHSIKSTAKEEAAAADCSLSSLPCH